MVPFTIQKGGTEVSGVRDDHGRNGKTRSSRTPGDSRGQDTSRHVRSATRADITGADEPYGPAVGRHFDIQAREKKEVYCGYG